MENDLIATIIPISNLPGIARQFRQFLSQFEGAVKCCSQLHLKIAVPLELKKELC